MKHLLLILALLTIPTIANAQCNGVFGASQTCGSVSGGPPGPIPFSAINVPGGATGQTQYNNGGAFGGYTPNGDIAVNPSTGVETIQPGVVTGSKIAPSTVANSNLISGAANTFKGSLNGSSASDISLVACSAIYQLTTWITGTGWQCNNQYVLPSRAIAATLNLSAFTSIQTLGYTTPGDGGGGIFKNVTTNSLIDSFINTFSITAGSGYTNNSYFGVVWVNSTKPFAIGTATVSGGTITAVSVAGTPGGLCHVGDVYTTGSIPAGTGGSITITGCTIARGSFTDTNSNNFQLLANQTFPNVLQFGAVGDWKGSDGSATDNFNAFQAAAWFVSYMDQLNAGNGGFWGGRLWVPQGTYLITGNTSTSLIIPNGVNLQGAGNQSAVLKMADTFGASVNFVELCDPNWHFACFDSKLTDIQLLATQTAGSSGGFAMVHSRSTQDFGGVYHTYIYGGKRQCLIFEHGDGGASSVDIDHLSCTTASASPQIVIGNTNASGLNYGTTMINMSDIVLGGPSSGSVFQSASGIMIFGGFVNILRLHCESMAICVEINNTGTTNIGQVWINNANAGSGGPAPAVTGLIQLDSTNTQQNTVASMIQAPGTGNTITNGVGGGSNFTGTITKPISCTTVCS